MKDDKLYLAHIRDAIRKICFYTAGGREEFMQNPMAQNAVVRNFEIIGEAAKRLSDHARKQRPEIPWRAISEFRNVLIHDYMGVDLIEVWKVIERDLPALSRAVEDLLK